MTNQTIVKTDVKSIANRLVDERYRLQLKAIEVYKFLDIAQTTYKNYETGDRDIPSSLLANLWHMGFDVLYVMTGLHAPNTMLSQVNMSDTLKKLTDSETKQLKTLVDIHNKLENDEQRQLVSQQIDSMLNKNQ